LDIAQSLSTIAGAGLGLAGFSGVMTAFMQRPGRFTELESYRVGVLLGVSFGAAFLALLPLALDGLEIPDSQLWRWASLAMLVYSCAALGAFLRASGKYRKQMPALFNLYLYWGIIAGHAANIALQFANAIGAAPAPSSGIYVAGLLWYLLHAAVQFSRILLVQPR
jgi:hypothetical protein